MAKLTTKGRKDLPKADFAGPNRSYPVNDANHARNALARAAQHASPAIKAEVRAKVYKDFPSIGKPKTAVGREVEKRLAARDKK